MNSGVILGPPGTLISSSWRCLRNFRLRALMSTPRMFIEPPRDVLRQAGPDGLVLHASIYTCAWQTSRVRVVRLAIRSGICLRRNAERIRHLGRRVAPVQSTADRKLSLRLLRETAAMVDLPQLEVQ